MAARRKVSMPPLPDEHEPIGELIERCRQRSNRRRTRKAAERWHPITFDEDRPFGVLWFGDPHLDDDGCHWDLLLRDVELCKSTDGLYGASVGDATNNWTGRLMRLYADQETGVSSARRLAKWFMRDAGIPWVLWNVGNHDAWEHGDAILSLIADGSVYLPGWTARVELRAAGQKWRIDSRHDFPGSSIYNKTHGPARAAIFGGEADVYICGHRHTYGYQTFEAAGGRIAHAIRCGSYKWDDSHAERLGFAQSHVPSVLTIFNPQATTEAGRVLQFADIETGVRVLTAMRAAPVKRKRSKNGTDAKRNRGSKASGGNQARAATARNVSVEAGRKPSSKAARGKATKARSKKAA